jgi:DNA-binding transcriptional ArsR family regulator
VDLETTDVTQKSNSNYYYFYIKSREKLLQIINSMKKSYPLISLNYKEERLRCFFEIKKNPGVRTRYGGNTRKAKILASLKEKPLSVNQLSVKLLIPPRSVRRHLTFLMDMKKIIKQKIRGEYIYF